MEPPGGRDSRFNLGYSMNLLSGESNPEIYGNPSLGRPSTSLQQLSPRHTMVGGACGGRGLKTDMYDDRAMSGQAMGLDSCVNDISEDTYGAMQSKKSPPSNGKKTKGRVKIKMEYIENKLRRYTTFSKRKTGIMKKAYELSTLTGTQVMLLVASETGHVYTFATRKLQPMITSEAGKALIQTCLNSPDPPAGSAGGDQRMSATGFEETELTYNISDDDSKEGESGSSESSEEPDQHEENGTEPLEDKLFPSEKQYQENFALPQNLKEKLLKKELDKVANQIVSNNKPNTNPVKVKLETEDKTNKQNPQTNSNLPLIIPGNENNPGLPQIPTSSGQMQAIPLLLQTPNGMGYATTPDGMILGLLQGPNILQPQLVALPITAGIGAKNDVKDKKS